MEMVRQTYSRLRAGLKAGISRTVNHIYFKPVIAAISLSIFIVVFVIASELTSTYAHYAAVIDLQLNVRLATFRGSDSARGCRRCFRSKLIRPEQTIR
jgi:hypothetical protein